MLLQWHGIRPASTKRPRFLYPSVSLLSPSLSLFLQFSNSCSHSHGRSHLFYANESPLRPFLNAFFFFFYYSFYFSHLLLSSHLYQLRCSQNSRSLFPCFCFLQLLQPLLSDHCDSTSQTSCHKIFHYSDVLGRPSLFRQINCSRQKFGGILASSSLLFLRQCKLLFEFLFSFSFFHVFPTALNCSSLSSVQDFCTSECLD